MNSVVITGRLVYEPEIKLTASQKRYISTRIAVSRNDSNKTTDFLNVQMWEKTAVFVQKYFHKGDPIELRGKIQTTTFDGEDGKKRSETYILVNEVCFVLKSQGQPTASAPVQNEPVQDAPTTNDNFENQPSGELPFEL